MSNQQLQMPSSFGGLMRYNEEYKSTFKFSPTQVIIFIVIVIVFVAVMKIFWPVSG
ncbi:MAG: preprotein translocase subunit Sec61beta [Nanoarchaeota archaeon]